MYCDHRMNNIATQIEALLFALGKPVSRADLAKMLGTSAEDIESAIMHLRDAGKDGRGVVLVDDGKEVELRAAPEAAELIARVRREELERDLGRAGAEVIAILLYQGSSTRARIDFIRGVNSSQALRTLAMRGLVRKTSEIRDRSVVYELTGELLASLGIAAAGDAPEYTAIRARLDSLREGQ